MHRDVLSVITAASGSFSKGQRRIAKYILENYDKAAFMTASKLGETVGISESTVVRFAAELGYNGYPAMRKALQEMIKNCLTSVQRIEVARDILNNEDVLTSVLTADVEKIHMTLEEVDRDAFNQTVDRLVKAEHVYVMGLRSSAPIASFMGFYLNMLVPNVRVVNESSASEIFEQILRISSGDVLVAISFPRYSLRTVRAMQYARDKGAEVIGITDSEASPVAGSATIRLYAKSDMLSFIDSLVAPLSLVNALIVAAANRSDTDIEAGFEELEKMWADYGIYEKLES